MIYPRNKESDISKQKKTLKAQVVYYKHIVRPVLIQYSTADMHRTPLSFGLKEAF